jgi:hypothetical protein
MSQHVVQAVRGSASATSVAFGIRRGCMSQRVVQAVRIDSLSFSRADSPDESEFIVCLFIEGEEYGGMW